MYRRVAIQHPPPCAAQICRLIYGSMHSARFGRTGQGGRPDGRAVKRNETRRNETRRDETKRDEARNKVRTEILRNNIGVKRFSGDRERFTMSRTLFSFSSPFPFRRYRSVTTTHNTHRNRDDTVFQRRKTTNDSDRDDNVSRTIVRFPQIFHLSCECVVRRAAFFTHACSSIASLQYSIRFI